jgi:hypothetical protein
MLLRSAPNDFERVDNDSYGSECSNGLHAASKKRPPFLLVTSRCNECVAPPFNFQRSPGLDRVAYCAALRCCVSNTLARSKYFCAMSC